MNIDVYVCMYACMHVCVYIYICIRIIRYERRRFTNHSDPVPGPRSSGPAKLTP